MGPIDDGDVTGGLKKKTIGWGGDRWYMCMVTFTSIPSVLFLHLRLFSSSEQNPPDLRSHHRLLHTAAASTPSFLSTGQSAS
ncbi:hypothetical protein L1987_43188 [Smallanthus sonchifolius]|uniref:Uncharacterized protein n=1 Tax=Smallanthus sonchifolius TaxID=185202 RepID=A0ACB9GLZ0_9ASTR|nr:hypothetical protein L1987_43188 [Smallanthus sonchifolius]